MVMARLKRGSFAEQRRVDMETEKGVSLKIWIYSMWS